jgi:hypothetical protein
MTDILSQTVTDILSRTVTITLATPVLFTDSLATLSLRHGHYSIFLFMSNSIVFHILIP